MPSYGKVLLMGLYRPTCPHYGAQGHNQQQHLLPCSPKLPEASYSDQCSKLKQDVLLQHGKSRLHAAWVTFEIFHELGFELLPHLHYSLIITCLDH